MNNTFSHCLLRIMWLLIACVGLAGCSTIKFGYNNFDDIAYWWMDGYIDFTDAQSPRVREDLARLLAWHRANELPRLDVLLGRMEQMVASDFSAEQACAFVAPLRERLRTAVEQAEPAAVTLVLDLAPEQLRHLERRYRRNNDDYRKDWVALGPAPLRDKRLAQLVERAEMVYGRLDEAQRALLRSQLEQSAFDPNKVLAERQRRQQDALALLGRLAGQPVGLAEARAQLRATLDRVELSPSAAWRQYEAGQIRENCRMLAALHAATTAAQRQSAIRRLRAWQRDLRELAGQP